MRVSQCPKCGWRCDKREDIVSKESGQFQLRCPKCKTEFWVDAEDWVNED